MNLGSTVVYGLLAVTLLLPLPSSAKSKLNRTQQSAISVFVTTAAISWVAVSPALGVSAAFRSVRGDDDVDEADEGYVDRTKAGPRPPLKVTGVDSQANGDIHVAVEVVGQPGQHGVLNWPARAGNPAETLRTGDVLAFKPSDEGSGWFLNDQGGQPLAFLPTESAQQSVMSTLW